MIRKRRRRDRRYVRLGWLALSLLFIDGVVYRGFISHRHFTQPQVTPATTAAAGVMPAVERHPQRAVYPYSVIRGGVYSAAEFDTALRQDSVASAHYAGFHRESLRMTNALAPMPMYASYRIGNAVYWTSHPIHVAAGEALITDGTNLARARCGNRLSASPQEPVTRMEPMEREMETPELLDFAEPAGMNARVPDSRALDKLFDLQPSSVLGSPLAFEIFPLASLPALSATVGTFGDSPDQAHSLSPSAWATLAGLLSAPPFPSPSFSFSENSVALSGESTQSVESSRQSAIETFQSTTPAALMKVAAATPPALPGLIAYMELFPDGSPQEGGVTGINPGQTATTTTNRSPPLTDAPAPSEPGWPSGNAVVSIDTGSSGSGANAAPEPATGFLVCAGAVFLCIVALRRGVI